MSHYNYVIIGGGMTADAAVRGIREVDASRSIGLFSMESAPPYNRPPLSKDLWKGTSMTSIWRKTADQGAELHLGCKVESIDPERRCIIDRRISHTFDKLLLTTGGTARQLPFGADQIIYFRTLADYRRLKALAEKGQHFVVIGGGKPLGRDILPPRESGSGSTFVEYLGSGKCGPRADCGTRPVEARGPQKTAPFRLMRPTKGEPTKAHLEFSM